MMTFVFTIFMSIVWVGIGWPVVRFLDRAKTLTVQETATFAFPIGGLILYAGVLLIGPFRLDGMTMWGLAGVMTLLAVPGWRAMPVGEALSTLGGLPDSMRKHPWTTFLWVTILVVGTSSLIQGMAPPNDYDGLMYHLSFPRYDVEKGLISIPWDRGLPHAFFPQFGSNISRFALATMNAGAAQMMHGLFGLLAAAGTALLVRRLGYGRDLALLSALLYLVCRAVIWEMGSSETDVPLSAFAVLTVLAYLAFWEEKTARLAALFGLMIGGGILFKLLGFVIALSLAPLILWDLIGRRVSFRILIAGPLAALLTILPHLISTFLKTGNPVYPLFVSVFNPDAVSPFDGVASSFGTGRGIDDFIMAPWTIFTMPMHYYDGMVFGAPYLLAFVPVALLGKGTFGLWRPVLSFVLLYFILWFWAFGQQTRFLLPIIPFLSGLAAVGLGVLWNESVNHLLKRSAVVLVIAAFALNQALFVGIYTLLRVPPAVGLMDSKTYHARTPTMGGAYYETCTYIASNLGPDEKYLSVTGAFHSFYCPQAPVVYNFFPDEAKWWLTSKAAPEMDAEEFIKRFKEWNFRYVIVNWAAEDRRGPTSEGGYSKRKNLAAQPNLIKIKGTDSRFSDYLDPALNQLEPVLRGRLTAVYDGPEILEMLQRQNP